MDVPLISVIIPVYNVEEYIEHCIKNILLQTYTNIEVIIVNDGSLDDSITIAKKMFEKSIENLYYASQLTEADIVVGSFCRFEEGMFYFYPKPKEDELLFPLSARDAIQGMDSMEDYTLLRYSAVWGKLFKKHLFDEIRFPKGKYAEDQFIMWKLYLASEKMTRYDSDIYAYRINFKGLTQNYNLSHLDFIEAIEERIETLLEMPELEYPMELAFNQYKFALKRNLSMLEGTEFVQEEAMVREKLEHAENGDYLFLENKRE